MPTSIDCRPNGKEQVVIGPPLLARYEAGTVLACKYRLELLLGEGGMGSVWLATNIPLDLPVAIKLIRTDLDHGSLRARLQIEARAAAKLGHPAIVRVYDVGESEFGDPFIVMEHLRGETLGEMLKNGRLPATRAVQLLLPIIDALAMTHGRGIVHRDLKPDNLMIALEEQQVCPKILDFGVAKVTDPRDFGHKLTALGAVVGSPEYMSPEQACGRDDVDARTDIWSMCVVLYEAVTGCPPFAASNYNALLRSIVEDEPKPLSNYAAGDGELWQILQRGLHKDRAQRYAQISELGQALAGWLLSRGLTEDACGSALESKWLGSRSGPLSVGRAASVRTSSEQLLVRKLDSIPDSTGIARGPFTQTVLPVTSRRVWKIGAAAATCAVLGAALLALGLSPRFARGPAAAPAPALAAAAAAPTAVPTTAVPSARLEPSEAAPLPKLEVSPMSLARPEPEAKAPAAATRTMKPASSAIRASAPVANSGPLKASPATPQHTRTLDLLAPY